jgi:predicted DCC family thiol-disulfide oxidoreductase YuxK
MPPLSYPITVFYDGACRMCVAQIRNFREKDKEKRLFFVDISRPDFDAKKYGLENASLQKYIYARDATGRLARGVDAFIWMWRACNQNFLAFFAGLPVLKQLGKLSYRLISFLRYKLFGRKNEVCDFHCAKEI